MEQEQAQDVSAQHPYYALQKNEQSLGKTVKTQEGGESSSFSLANCNKKETICAVMASTGSRSAAYRAVGICERTLYRWLEEDADFAAAFHAACESVCDKVEEMVIERACSKSTLDAIFYLRGRRRHVFGDYLRTDISVGPDDAFLDRLRQAADAGRVPGPASAPPQLPVPKAGEGKD